MRRRQGGISGGQRKRTGQVLRREGIERMEEGKRCHGWVRRGMGGSVVCQGCRWCGSVVTGATGAPSTVPLALYAIQPSEFPHCREGRMGEGVSQGEIYAEADMGGRSPTKGAGGIGHNL